jgi:hypothetical protein
LFAADVIYDENQIKPLIASIIEFLSGTDHFLKIILDNFLVIFLTFFIVTFLQHPESFYWRLLVGMFQ